MYTHARFKESKFKSGSWFTIYEKNVHGKELAGPFETRGAAEAHIAMYLREQSVIIIETPKDPFEGL